MKPSPPSVRLTALKQQRLFFFKQSENEQWIFFLTEQTLNILIFERLIKWRLTSDVTPHFIHVPFRASTHLHTAGVALVPSDAEDVSAPKNWNNTGAFSPFYNTPKGCWLQALCLTLSILRLCGYKSLILTHGTTKIIICLNFIEVYFISILCCFSFWKKERKKIRWNRGGRQFLTGCHLQVKSVVCVFRFLVLLETINVLMLQKSLQLTENSSTHNTRFKYSE